MIDCKGQPITIGDRVSTALGEGYVHRIAMGRRGGRETVLRALVMDCPPSESPPSHGDWIWCRWFAAVELLAAPVMEAAS